jgi:hypothetical protein
VTEKQKIPAWLGTAVAIITLCLGLVANYADRVADEALIDARVSALEEKHQADADDAKRLQTLETMVCLIGAHLKVPGLSNGNCNR